MSLRWRQQGTRPAGGGPGRGRRILLPSVGRGFRPAQARNEQDAEDFGFGRHPPATRPARYDFPVIREKAEPKSSTASASRDLRTVPSQGLRERLLGLWLSYLRLWIVVSDSANDLRSVGACTLLTLTVL